MMRIVESEGFHPVKKEANQSPEPTATVGGFGDAKISIFIAATSPAVSPVAVAHL